MENKPLNNIKYKNNFLTNVIFKIDFNEIGDFNDEMRNKITSIVTGTFNYPETQEVSEFATKIENNQIVAHKIDKIPMFIFHDSEFKKERRLVFSKKYLTVEFLKYTNFNDFYEAISLAIKAFDTICPDSYINRMGLRYINQVIVQKKTPLKWKNFIDESLTKNVNVFFNDDNGISRALSQVFLNKDIYFVNFIYGLFNSDFPAKINKSEFLLDYDCFMENIESKAILENVTVFHDEINGLFEKSIKNELRKIMEVISNE